MLKGLKRWALVPYQLKEVQVGWLRPSNCISLDDGCACAGVFRVIPSRENYPVSCRPTEVDRNENQIWLAVRLLVPSLSFLV
jgi:hypothetical protein